MYNHTYLEQLSSRLVCTLSAFESPEFQQIRQDFSSLTHAITSLEQEVTSSLSAIPLHPYERLKYDYFGPDYNFKTIDDLEEPTDIPHEKCLDILKQKYKDIISTSYHNLTCCEEEKIRTVFTICSGDKILPDHDTQKKYIEFLEIARNIPIDSVTNDNYQQIAKKLIGAYFKII